MALHVSTTDRRHLWTAVFGLSAAAFWIVGVGAGWRAWLLLDDLDSGRGLVAHAQAFGTDASIWWVPAAILTVTTVVIALGIVMLRALASPQDLTESTDVADGTDETDPEPSTA